MNGRHSTCAAVAAKGSAWPNGVASRPKFLICVYLQVRFKNSFKLYLPKGSSNFERIFEWSDL